LTTQGDHATALRHNEAKAARELHSVGVDKHLPLAGVRVVELAHMISVPTGARILADLGASVTKVEPPSGDITRRIGPTSRTATAMFVTANRGKRLVTADIREQDGVERVLGLIEDADVFVSNLDEGMLAAAGLDSAALRARFPDLVAVTMHGGQGGRSTDGLAQATTGLTTVTGPEDGSGYRTGASVVDTTAGVWVALTVLAGLRGRDHGSGGSHARFSLEDVCLFMQYPQVGFAELAPEIGRRRGNHSPLVCTPMFDAADGRIAVTILSDRHWAALCAATGRADLVDDPRFASAAARMGHQPDVETELDAAFGAHDRAYWTEALAKAGVPAGAERGYPEVIALDAARPDPMVERTADEPEVPVVRIPPVSGPVVDHR
jgi:CoA:oxalate CoA-transferase